MTPENEFWSSVHRLAVAYNAVGLTTEERVENLVQQFKEMSALARRELLIDLFEIVEHCADIYTHVAAAANQREQTAAARAG